MHAGYVFDYDRNKLSLTKIVVIVLNIKSTISYYPI